MSLEIAKLFFVKIIMYTCLIKYSIIERINNKQWVIEMSISKKNLKSLKEMKFLIDTNEMYMFLLTYLRKNGKCV